MGIATRLIPSTPPTLPIYCIVRFRKKTMFVDQNSELIARELGITVEELVQLHYEEGSEEDHGVIHTYYMRFSDENPWRIMVKIKGLQGSTLRLNPSIFEGPNKEEYPQDQPYKDVPRD